MKRSELLARISTHLRVKEDATWVTSIVNGVLQEDTEAMQILKSILPECIIARMQVCDICYVQQLTSSPCTGLESPACLGDALRSCMRQRAGAHGAVGALLCRQPG